MAGDEGCFVAGSWIHAAAPCAGGVRPLRSKGAFRFQAAPRAGGCWPHNFARMMLLHAGACSIHPGSAVRFNPSVRGSAACCNRGDFACIALIYRFSLDAKGRKGMAGGLSLKFGFARCRKWNESVRYLRPSASPIFAAMQRSAWLSAGVGERFTMTRCLPAK